MRYTCSTTKLYCATFRGFEMLHNIFVRHFLFILVVFVSSLLFSFGFPSTAFAQKDPVLKAPETIEETKQGILNIGDKIIQAIPTAVASIWANQVIPVWKAMGEWVKTEIWEKRVSPALQTLLDRGKTLLGQEVERRKPIVEQEFEKEKQEFKEDIKEVGKDTGKSLWERFQALFHNEQP